MSDALHRPALADRLTGRGPLLLGDARVPVCLLAEGAPDGAAVDRDGAARVDILLDGASVAAVVAAGRIPRPGTTLALGGRHVWPMLIDMHSHLDKGHILGRAPESGGIPAGASEATARDRDAHWSREDLEARMEFALACAEGHGVAAIRTHLDSQEDQAAVTWDVFAEIRARWSDRIALQAVALLPLDAFDGDYGAALADLVAARGGLLGGVTQGPGGRYGTTFDDLDARLDRLFRLAAERDLGIDLHVDETAKAGALAHVAEAALRHGYEGRVTCGHCCALARLPEEALHRVIGRVKQAGISLVALPTVNMYLQDRMPGRTPRWRGVMPVHELRAADVPVAVAGDNCRDPFHAYGDHDMVDTWRQAVRILHLDHPFADAPALAGPVPAAITGFGAGVIGPGRQADLTIFEAFGLDQLVARPQADRILIRRGALSSARAPAYPGPD